MDPVANDQETPSRLSNGIVICADGAAQMGAKESLGEGDVGCGEGDGIVMLDSID